MVVERADSYGEHGFGISLYPYGSAVLHGIGAHGELAAGGVEMKAYEIGDGRGRVIRRVDFACLLSAYGPTWFTTHAGLIDVLRRAGRGRVELRMGTTVDAVEEVEVGFGGGSTGRFDLLVGCDGIGSATRELLFGAQPGFDTGWVGWTW